MTGQWFSPAGSNDRLFQSNEESVWFDQSNDILSQEYINNDQTNYETNSEDDNPVYAGASIRIAQSAILMFAPRHNLHVTGECLSDLLTLISLHYLTTSFIHESLYQFHSYFSTLKSPIVFHKS